LWVDVAAFEEAATVARRAREPATYRAAIDVYTGDLLPQDRYEVWAEDRREELRQLYLSLLLELAGLYEERQEFESAVETLRKAVAIEPAYEEAHAALMGLYAASGRHHRRSSNTSGSGRPFPRSSTKSLAPPAGASTKR
jgi:DNA-binding SARP family transcriptional activator